MPWLYSPSMQACDICCNTPWLRYTYTFLLYDIVVSMLNNMSMIVWYNMYPLVCWCKYPWISCMLEWPWSPLGYLNTCLIDMIYDPCLLLDNRFPLRLNKHDSSMRIIWLISMSWLKEWFSLIDEKHECGLIPMPSIVMMMYDAM